MQITFTFMYCFPFLVFFFARKLLYNKDDLLSLLLDIDTTALFITTYLLFPSALLPNTILITITC